MEISSKEDSKADGNRENTEQDNQTTNGRYTPPLPSPARSELHPPVLSLRTESSQSLERIPDAAAEPAEDALHVLIVDDNRINVDLLVKFMRKHKMSYGVAFDGKEALEKYQESCQSGKKRFHYVLMDIQMPIMGGLESTRRIREYEEDHELTPRTTVITLTAYASNEAKQEASASGADTYLPKPVKFSMLKGLLVDKEKLKEDRSHDDQAKQT